MDGQNGGNYLTMWLLIEAVKGGNSQLKVEEPLIVYNKDGSYTAELLDMYGMKE